MPLINQGGGGWNGVAVEAVSLADRSFARFSLCAFLSRRLDIGLWRAIDRVRFLGFGRLALRLIVRLAGCRSGDFAGLTNSNGNVPFDPAPLIGGLEAIRLIDGALFFGYTGD